MCHLEKNALGKRIWRQALVVCIIFGFLAWLLPRSIDRGVGLLGSELIKNYKELHMSLFMFDQEFLEFPNDETYKSLYPDSPLPTNSEEMLRQLKEVSEKGIKIPNGTGYIAGLSSCSPTGSVILAWPMVGEGLLFDPEPLRSKAILLRLDGSASAERIAEDGHVYINGEKLFESTLSERGDLQKIRLCLPKKY